MKALKSKYQTTHNKDFEILLHSIEDSKEDIPFSLFNLEYQEITNTTTIKIVSSKRHATRKLALFRYYKFVCQF